ncbi:OB-fold nucleic acid binding domain-containing protein [Pseudooceanicola sp.]|jgi:DNA polymerase III alpha subunit|uniref:OB-fold nucleic acid binding domain-containing protein n=1 Tax=Pseudooceanicola sp. TaxID=1914328 RepID=UPI00405926B4
MLPSHLSWPNPPSAIPAAMLDRPPGNARVTVAGIVILRQRPGTAKGVIFLTLEDETGIVNVIVWRKLYEAFRRAVISGRMLRVTGRVQRDSGVTHVIAERIEDISAMLDALPALGVDKLCDRKGGEAARVPRYGKTG